jgi:hypothetical protein
MGSELEMKEVASAQTSEDIYKENSIQEINQAHTKAGNLR